MAYNQEFGEIMRELLAEHGGPRAVGPKVGIHPGTLYDWAKGMAPRAPYRLREFVDRLPVEEPRRGRLLTAVATAKGSADTADEEEAALIERVADAAARKAVYAVNGAERLLEGIADLAREFGRTSIPIHLESGKRPLSVEEAEGLLADIREQLLEEQAEQGGGT